MSFPVDGGGKDEIWRGKTNERMYKTLQNNERFTISTGAGFLPSTVCHV